NPAESGVTLPGLKTSAVVEISWDCRWITTTSEGRVRVWPLGLPSLLDIVNATVGRELTNEERNRYLVD
ncbi:MAG TPA: hypothetical protein VH851_13950, partial [Candidatus Binatia bacterium]